MGVAHLDPRGDRGDAGRVRRPWSTRPGVADAGIFGDILCARMRRRGVAALVTDGAVRDADGVTGTGLPVWCAGRGAAPLRRGPDIRGLAAADRLRGGVAIFPDDIILADGDGAVVIPASMLDHVLAEAPEQERREAWTMAEIEAGAALPGLYPMNEETAARYAKHRTER